jgi:Protein of unknown function (DUF1460)
MYLSAKICFLSIFSFVFFQNTQSDESIFQQKMQLPKGNSLTETVLNVAHSFEGTPYVSNTLEKEGQESLVLNLRALDCVTFVENTLAIALTKRNNGTFEQYKQYLTKIRYRNGRINGYPSRLHYFTDALHEAAVNGYLTDVTQKCGGTPYRKVINYMSTHTAESIQITTLPDKARILAAENDINQRKLYYIQKNKIQFLEQNIQSGDVIATTTAMNGMDVTHTGFAVLKKGRVHFLHASYNHKKVLLTTEPLTAYMLQKKSQSGIIVYRVKE